jgi:hypothetical protein
MPRVTVALIVFSALLPAAEQPGPPRPRGSGPEAFPPSRMLQELDSLSRRERARLLERLPPERRKRLEMRLLRFDQMSPGEKEKLRNRWEKLDRLSPQRQREVSEVWSDWNGTEPERRLALRNAFEDLSNLPAGDRPGRLDSPESLTRFTAWERNLLRRMLEVLVPGPIEARHK